MKSKFFRRALLGLGCLLAASTVKPASAQNIAVKSGEKIAFLGDSITAQGAGSPTGYVRLVISGLAANDVKAEAIPAGVSGHKSNDMLARLDRDVLQKKPQWMTLSCGVNDVWHGARGVKLEDYKTNITSIVDQATAAGIKVVILTSTLIHEDLKDTLNDQAIPYNDFLRQLAKDKNLPLADLNADFRAARNALSAEDQKKGTVFTVDGVHMNTSGNFIMASGVLRAFGLNDAQLAKAKDAWLDIPGAMQLGLTMRQYQSLETAATRNKKSVAEALADAVKKYADAK